MDDVTAMLSGDPVFAPKGDKAICSSSMKASNFQDIGFFEPAVIVSLSERKLWMNPERVALWVLSVYISRVESPFSYAILYVVFLRAFEQVRAIAAWRPITIVAYVKRIRVLPALEEVSDACRKIGFTARDESTISSLVPSACPWPTFIWPANVNMLPKPGNIFWRKVWERLRIVNSHLISLTDLAVRVVRMLDTFSRPANHSIAEAA